MDIKGRLLGMALICFSFLAAHAEQGVSFKPFNDNGITRYQYNAATGKYEEAVQEPKAFLGVMVRKADGEDGLKITDFVPGSAAEKAGIPLGAVLLTLDGKKLDSIDRLLELLGDKKPGDKVEIRYTYQGEGKTAAVVLGERTEEVMREIEDMDLEEPMLIEIEEPEEMEVIEPAEPGYEVIRRKRIRDNQGEERRERVIIRKERSEAPGAGYGGNDLSLTSIEISKKMPDGVLEVGFEGVTGKVDVLLMTASGRIIEAVSMEDLQGPFSYSFRLGAGAQGEYMLHIMSGDRKHVERIAF